MLLNRGSTKPWATSSPKHELALQQNKQEALVVSQHSPESHEVICYLAVRTVRQKAAARQLAYSLAGQ